MRTTYEMLPMSLFQFKVFVDMVALGVSISTEVHPHTHVHQLTNHSRNFMRTQNKFKTTLTVSAAPELFYLYIDLCLCLP